MTVCLSSKPGKTDDEAVQTRVCVIKGLSADISFYPYS